ncbi:MAG: hypothetical protein U0235_06935 [Polyangiaceae bacterium]
MRLDGVVQDEHRTSGLGRGTQDQRARLKVILRGRLEATVGDATFDLGPGDFLLIPCIADCRTRGGDDETLELDWDAAAPIAGRSVPRIETGALGTRAREAAHTLSDALRDADADHGLSAFSGELARACDALAAVGLPLDPRGARDAAESAAVETADADQRLLSAIDRTLEELHAGPAAIELESRLGWSRRTITRRTTELHARLGLSGQGGESWRAVRDFYRLLVGTILASNARMTTRALSTVLGYASPDALFHAFANAGLPSPGALRA